MQRVIFLRRPLLRRDPRGLQQRLERAFQSQWQQPGAALLVAKQPELWQPPTDVYETEQAFVVQIELAGMRDAEVAITLDEHALRVEGRRAGRPAARPLGYYQMGIGAGTFVVEVYLGRPFDAERVTARYDDGFLFVELPKPAPVRVRVADASVEF